jgi:hypothetical protein
MNTGKTEVPQIGLIISSKGVRGVVVLGSTLKTRQKSLSLLDLLEPDLIEVQRLLNQRIETLKGNSLERLGA